MILESLWNEKEYFLASDCFGEKQIIILDENSRWDFLIELNVAHKVAFEGEIIIKNPKTRPHKERPYLQYLCYFFHFI